MVLGLVYNKYPPPKKKIYFKEQCGQAIVTSDKYSSIKKLEKNTGII